MRLIDLYRKIAGVSQPDLPSHNKMRTNNAAGKLGYQVTDSDESDPDYNQAI